MTKIISFKRAAQISLLLFALFMLFHLAIITGILVFNFVPIKFLWGGRMETRQQLLGFEIVSFIIMSVCFLLVLVRTGKLPFTKLRGAARIGLWMLFFLFLLNTAGNFFAKTTFEKLFALVTAVLAMLMLRLALEHDDLKVQVKT